MSNRYDFVLLFDAQDANPNGDPDAGNLPRLDAETGQGLVTDVCLKRKVRNFIQTVNPEQRIYFTDGGILNNKHREAYTALNMDPKTAKAPEHLRARTWMCEHFFDIRTFGAVMSTEVNCGQVRGPVQLSFARSIDPIVSSEHAITRSSVTNEKDVDKGRTIGRKFTIPYGLYRAHGFVNPYLAKQTGFSDTDLELFFTALENAFQFDQSAARPAGSMAVRALKVFKHDSELGHAPSHALFDRITVQRKDPVKSARAFGDYTVTINEENFPAGITLIQRI